MPQRIPIKAKNGQPFRLGPEEVAVFQAANKWTVFYLAYPKGEWMHMPAAEWQRLACPISIDPTIVVSGREGSGKAGLFPIGMCVRHITHGDGYVTCHDRRVFEVCFFRTGPQLLRFSSERENIKPIAGVGELWPGLSDSRRDSVSVLPSSDSQSKASVSRNPPVSAPPCSSDPFVKSGNGEPIRPQLARSPLPLRTAPIPALESASEPVGIPFSPTHPRINGRPCTCGGSNENCMKCFGSGWIEPKCADPNAGYQPRSPRNRRKRGRR